MEMQRPSVGVGVCIVSERKVLLGKRKSAHGIGTWSFPGGHLEYGESWEECAKRETLEETGVLIRNIRFATATNDLFEQEGKHYVTIIMIAEVENGEPDVREPEKCECWEWYAWNERTLPKELFCPLRHLLRQHFDPFV